MRAGRQTHSRHCLSSFQLSRIINEQLAQDDVDEVNAAEELTKMFLTWEIEDDGFVLSELRKLVGDIPSPAEEESGSGSVLPMERISVPGDIVVVD